MVAMTSMAIAAPTLYECLAIVNIHNGLKKLKFVGTLRGRENGNGFQLGKRNVVEFEAKWEFRSEWSLLLTDLIIVQNGRCKSQAG